MFPAPPQISHQINWPLVCLVLCFCILFYPLLAKQPGLRLSASKNQGLPDEERRFENGTWSGSQDQRRRNRFVYHGETGEKEMVMIYILCQSTIWKGEVG